MTTNFVDEQKAETYKSMISISVEGFKLLALLNGGAAAGIIAAFDKVSASVEPFALKRAIVAFVVGLVLTVCAFMLSYLTQFSLFEELLGRRKANFHMRFFWIAFSCCVLSLIAFSWGALSAAFGIR